MQRDADKNRDCFHKACCLFFVSSLIKGAVGGFIYRRAPAAGRSGLNVLLMEKIMSKTGFFRALTEDEREDVQADEKVKKNFQQNTQIYPCVCLHTSAYRKIHALRPHLKITVTSDRHCEMKC